MSNLNNAENRGLQLTQANLQARQQRQSNALPSTVLSNVSYSSAANSILGDLPITGVGGLRMSKRNSVSSDHYSSSHYNYAPYHVASVRMENTYRLGPHETQRFNSMRISRLVNDIVRNHLENVKYEANKCRDLVQLLSDEIKMRTKLMVYKRYKLIVNLTIGQAFGNSLIMASRALWNPETDNECTVTYKNNSLFAIATIFACYYD